MWFVIVLFERKELLLDSLPALQTGPQPFRIHHMEMFTALSLTNFLGTWRRHAYIKNNRDKQHHTFHVYASAQCFSLHYQQQGNVVRRKLRLKKTCLPPNAKCQDTFFYSSTAITALGYSKFEKFIKLQSYKTEWHRLWVGYRSHLNRYRYPTVTFLVLYSV